jgi:hypothetical protein
MEVRIQLFAIVAAGALLLVVLELVRRRRLLERYALLWLLSCVVLLALAVWRGLLSRVADWAGIAYPPNALFLIAFGFVLVLLLHFSTATSRLTDQTKVLAQKYALLEEELRQLKAKVRVGEAQAEEDVDEDEEQEPVATPRFRA